MTQNELLSLKTLSSLDPTVRKAWGKEINEAFVADTSYAFVEI